MRIRVETDGILYPVELRLRTTDISVFEEVLVNAEYQFAFSSNARVIVDAGANIGLTSVFFANRYPGARIFAVEPESSNFALLADNVSPYENVVPIQAALWGETTWLNLANPGTGNWGFQTESHNHSAPAEGLVRGWTLDELMRKYNIDYIDVLKIDIEGAEKEVFETAERWIDRVGTIVIELHDRFKPGCSRVVYCATKDFPYELRRGETVVLSRVRNAASLNLATSCDADSSQVGPRNNSQRRRRSRIVASSTST